ncbi:MAG: type II and III secretion system protein [Candidatus Cloacimonetes bacterium]|nr:type II and III secretion system protein [Candidatus Cloacimonadota bacterium]
MDKRIILILMLCCLIIGLAAQTRAVDTTRLSIHPATHINDAVQILEGYALRSTGKKLVNLSSYNGSINVPINDLDWKKALELILLQNNLTQEELPGLISIVDVKSPIAESAKKVDPIIQDAQLKQVRIKAVAMLADRSYLKNLGVDWSSVANGKVNVSTGFAGASQLTSPFSISGGGNATIGSHSVEISTLLRTIETDQKGNIIAEPSILVSSGKSGYIQVGQDISIKTADEAGNTKDTFFSTGIIMTVTPEVVELEGEELIKLQIAIERSSGQPSAVSTVISTSKSNTELMLYDQEQTVIAGLLDTDEVKVRSGIPILKDLPWWVFGIRYLAGYDSYEKKERELIISIKAEIMDTALERLRRARTQENLMN